MRTPILRVNGRKNLPGQATPAADIENEGGALEIEELESTAGHGRLDILDTGGGGVLARLGVIVVDVGGAVQEEN